MDIDDIIMRSLLGIAGLVIAGLLFILPDMMLSVPNDCSATVITRSFTPSSTSVGTGVTSGGKTATVVTSTEEKWSVVIEVNGDTRSAEAVSPKRWAQLNTGDHVTARIYKGRFTGIEWSTLVL